MATSGEFYSVACAFIWAVSVILFRKGGESVPPVALNLFKDVIALVLFGGTLLVLRLPLAPPECDTIAWVTLLVSGAIGIGIADSLFFASLNRLGAVGSSIVNSLYSPFVVAGAALYLHEPVGVALLTGAALMVGAILVGTWEPARTRVSLNRRAVVEGIALGILSMALMATGIVIAKPVLVRVDPWWAATVRVVGGIALLALQGLAPRNRRAFVACFRPGAVWRYTIPAAIIGGYVAMVMWVMGFKYAAAGIAGVLNQTSSIFALVLAALFLEERINARKVTGILLAFAGAVVVML